MAEGILYGIAQEILKNLGSRALDETALAWGFKDRLDKLKSTVNTINNVLLDAEDRQVDSRAVRDWLERLAIVVYAADDLFDEVATIASRKQVIGGNRLAKEVRTFFSSSNQIKFAFSISRKIKVIREKLDDIVQDNTQFVFQHRPHEQGGVLNTIRGRDQTYSYVDSTEVIGRDGDKEIILDLLFASSESENDGLISVIPIVGIGGQGKTTLAQLIYNDPRVVESFELRIWVCVSEEFDIKVISEKILKSASEMEKGSEMEQLQGLMRNKLSDKRYLLVLDDVWNENRDQWLKLMALLKVGRKGSKILVTTRSLAVAKIMGTVPPHELQGLMKGESWELFQKMAFEPGQAEAYPNLVEVGKEIVKKCANVPLAIRSLGSLLYGQSESRWLAVKDTSLAHINDDQTNIMSILKLSYNNLWSPLKNCFSYCALFPKDHNFDKETLIALWMAEGFIIPTSFESQSLEQLGEEYFLTLLQRCFFQDIGRDEWGEISSCKMHDLIHDLAQNVVGLSCKVVKHGETNFDTRVRHVSFDYNLNSQWKIPSSMQNLKHLRTFLMPKGVGDGSPFSTSICKQLISTFSCLRVLDLHELTIKSLPSSIGILIHLRFLDLSKTPIKKVPESIIKLHNLQTLKLEGCTKLNKYPTSIRALTNLVIFDVTRCNSALTPPGIGNLTSLHKLPLFIISSGRNTARLSDLKNLDGLRGDLYIIIVGEFKDPVLEVREANLGSKQGLKLFRIRFLKLKNYKDGGRHDEATLEGLKPHPNLRCLMICGYDDQKLPSWLMMNNLTINLPNLVEIELRLLGECQQVPCFGQLPFLKSLRLINLKKVEYMEMESSGLYEVCSLLEPTLMKTPFFPSLEDLVVIEMEALKGWWKEVGERVANDNTEEASPEIGKQQILSSISFPKLLSLVIESCPNLQDMPLSPNAEILDVADSNATLTMSRLGVSPSKLKKLRITEVEQLISLPRDSLQQLTDLIVYDKLLVSTNNGPLGEVLTSLSSLKYVKFMNCESLRYVDQGLGNVPALQRLYIQHCQQLDLSINEELPWKNLKSLWLIKFIQIPKLVGLPSGFQHLKLLNTLLIESCVELKELPEWIGCLSSLWRLKLSDCPKVARLPQGLRNLTSLQKLEIVECPRLTKICRPPNGTEWPKIQHIPFVSIRELPLDDY